MRSSRRPVATVPCVLTPNDAQVREFAAAFRELAQWAQALEPAHGHRNEVVALVQDFLGDAGLAFSVVSRQLPPFEHVNLQAALDTWTSETGREVLVHGVGVPPHHEAPDLAQLVSGEHIHRLRLCPPPLVDLPDGPGSTRGCLLRCVLLVTDARGPYVVFVSAADRHEPTLDLQVAGLSLEAAQQVFSELEDLRSRLNVYRGHVLDVQASHGGVRLSFAEVPATRREDVVLPEGLLHRIERHALGVAAHREALLAVGQHLKRGLLLYGPPGTGKTHTTRYLVGQMDGYTRLLLTGQSMHAVGSVATIARSLAPAAVLVEDVDLVASDREYGDGGNTVLFDLLDAMDGTAGDADLLFLLTTNRADLLEVALAARPGRVDVAVEIGLPDAVARRRLFELYLHAVPRRLDASEVDDVVQRTSGVTASFLKELVRRAVLESLDERSPLEAVEVKHVRRALDDLLDSAQGLTRSLLGVGSAPAAVATPRAAQPTSEPVNDFEAD
jgi:ATPase family associated with various cellular activities (AAA)